MLRLGLKSIMWDRQGREFVWFREVDRETAQRLVTEPEVQVAIYACVTALRWIEPQDRSRVWRDELAPNLNDDPDWKPPRGAPGQRPFSAELWREVNGNAAVLLFNDHD